MKLVLEVNTKDEAVEAISLLSLYAGKVVADTEEKPAPKRTPRKTAAKKEVIEDPEDGEEGEEPEEEKPAPKKRTPAKKAPTLNAKTLTEKAKEAIAVSSKEEVKEVIAKYGARISAVADEDLQALNDDLQEMIDNGEEV